LFLNLNLVKMFFNNNKNNKNYLKKL